MDYLERYRDIIPDFDGFWSILHRPLPTSVRINALKISRYELLDLLDGAAVDYQILRWYSMGLRLKLERPGKLLEHMLGYIHVQEEVSMVPPLLLDPKPGEGVLDLCAAPGSKTTQLSSQMMNKGLIIANEPSLARIVPLRSNCERLGAMNVAITRYDGRNFPHHLFDRVLVDAPCSSEGRARKDMSVLKRCSPKRSLDLQVLQIGLLKRAAMLAKPGGTIIYSTCTYAPEENEAVVQKVLEEHRDQVFLDSVCVEGLRECPGLCEWSGIQFDYEMKRCARYYPHKNDTGGFFVAKLKKI